MLAKALLLGAKTVMFFSLVRFVTSLDSVRAPATAERLAAMAVSERFLGTARTLLMM